MVEHVEWTVKIGVDESWIADGFELDPAILKEAILNHILGYAYDDEVSVDILKAPDEATIEAIQNGG